MKRVFQLSFIAFALFGFILNPPHGNAAIQTNYTGTWSSDFKPEKPEKLYLSFERKTEKGHNQNGSAWEYSDLQGLTREQTAGSGAVSFRIVREAGTIDCEGRFDNNKGAGTFRFTPNQSFVIAMKTRGFDFTENKNGRENDVENRLFTATNINLTTAFADDLLSANFGNLTVEELFKAKIFNVTSQFMREMKATGFPNLGMEELVKARIFKIDADFVKRVATMGFKDQSMESLVKMSIFKISPEFINEVQDQGFNNLAIEQLVKLRTFKIDAAFIKEIKAEGYNNISVEELVKMKIFKIDSAFIRKAKVDKTVPDVEELVRMKIGVRTR